MNLTKPVINTIFIFVLTTIFALAVFHFGIVPLMEESKLFGVEMYLLPIALTGMICKTIVYPIFTRNFTED
mgnify:CR=1 FL=1